MKVADTNPDLPVYTPDRPQRVIPQDEVLERRLDDLFGDDPNPKPPQADGYSTLVDWRKRCR